MLKFSISKNVSEANFDMFVCIRSNLDQKILPSLFHVKYIGEKQSSDNNLNQIFYLKERHQNKQFCLYQF